MGWRDIISSPDPSRALYLAMRANPTASRAADVFQSGFEGVVGGGMNALGRFGDALAIPARAIAGAATNSAGLGAPVDVSDYALFGRDLETGRTATQYGDLLAGTLEDAGEMKPGGFASKVIRFAGNTITDPAAAPALLSGAEAVGALAGRLTPGIQAAELAPRRRPLGRVDPNYGQSPPAAHNAPPRGGGYRAPGAKVPLTSSPEPAPGKPGGPGVTSIPQGPAAGNSTQEIPARLRGTGEGPVGLRTEPAGVHTMPGGATMADADMPGRSPFMGSGNRPTAGNPTATQDLHMRTQPVRLGPTDTQPVPFHPDATQPTPMTRGPGGRGHLRPKALRKSRAGKGKEE